MTTGSVGVSVIIPIYNRPEFLRRSIASVLKQTYQNLEIIAVDDYGSEDIKRVLDEANDHRIIYIRNKGAKGPAGSRNTGMRAARGKYVAFLDYDDEFLPNHLDDSVSVLDNEPQTHLVFGKPYYYRDGYEKIDYMWPNLIKKVNSITNVTDKGNYLVFNDFLFKFILQAGCFFNLSSVVIKREVVDKGFLMNESLIQTQDMDFYQRLSRFYKFAYLKNGQINYHVHSYNVSTTGTGEQKEENFIELLKTYHVMSNYDFLDSDDKKILNKNIATVYFNYGYYKKNRRAYKSALIYYIKSLRYHLRLLVFMACLKVLLLWFWSLLRIDKQRLL